MGDMEKEETVKKPPTIAISPSFLYGVTAGVKVNIATGKTSPAIAPFHVFGYSTAFDFITKYLLSFIR